MESDVKAITYHFKLENGKEKEFTVRLQSPGLRQDVDVRGVAPEWTKLENHQCPNCPLTPAESPRCPVAVSLLDVVEFFKEHQSFEVVEMRIFSNVREYGGTKSLQSVLNSLMGLQMATAGCPVLDALRPMVFTHLPFSTMEETLYRVIAMYLVAQFLRQRRGQTPDWELKDLVKIYEQIYAVNIAFVERLRSIDPKDASLNAIASLDCFGAFARFSLEKKHLEQFEAIFEAHLKEKGAQA